MIELRHVHKAIYTIGQGRSDLLVDVSMAIPSNQRVAVLGKDHLATGMLLHLIAGSEVPDKGSVKAEGIKFSPVINNKGVAGATLVFRFSALENMRYFSDAYGVDYHELVRVVDAGCGFGRDLALPLHALNIPRRRALEMSLIAALPFHCYLVDRLQTIDKTLIWQLYRVAELRNAGIIFTTNLMIWASTLGNAGVVSFERGMRSFYTVRDAIDAHEGLLELASKDSKASA